MKKITALLLSLLMLIPMMTMGISADTTTTTSLDDKLVLHYDFEGESEAEARKNKAYKGTSTEASARGDLMEDTNASHTVAPMEWDSEAGTYAYPYSTTNAYGPYVHRNFIKQYVVNKEYTIFIRMKFDPDCVKATTTNSDYTIIQYNATSGNPTLKLTFRDSMEGEGTTDYFSLWINDADGSNARNTNVPFDDLKEGYINFAAVVYNDGTNYISRCYYSFGTPASAADWTAPTATATIGTSMNDPGTQVMFLFGQNTKGGVIMDDFRVYTDDLTLSELQSISAKSFGYSLDDACVLHYDFEGSTVAEAYTNRANNGTTAETGALQDGTLNMVLDKGTIASTENPTNYNQSPYISKDYIGKYIGGDVEFTIFTRLKLDDSLSANPEESGFKTYSFLNMKRNADPTINANFVDNGTKSSDFFQVYINNEQHRFFGITFEDLQADFVNVAIIVYKGAEGLYAKMYASKGIPAANDQWTELTENQQKGASFGTSVVAPGMNMFIVTPGDALGGIIMDDFRFYSVPLTTGDLQTIINEDFKVEEEPIVPSPNVNNFGAQMKYEDLNGDKTNDAFSVRFVGGIDSLDYDHVGIEITLTVGDDTADAPVKQTSHTVYGNIWADGVSLKPENKGCKYFMAFIIPDVPLDLELADGEHIVFKYRFFAVNDAETLYSEYGTTAYNADGTLVSSVD